MYSVITNCKASASMLILVKMDLKCSLRGLKFQKSFGGLLPDPLEMVVFYHKTDSYFSP